MIAIEANTQSVNNMNILIFATEFSRIDYLIWYDAPDMDPLSTIH